MPLINYNVFCEEENKHFIDSLTFCHEESTMEQLLTQ